MDIEAVLLKKEIGTNFYHSTFDDFESFDMEKSMFGMHFGTKETAVSRVEIKKQEIIKMGGYSEKDIEKMTKSPIVFEVELDYKNPLILGENRVGVWSPHDILRTVIEKAELEEVKGITDQDIEDFYNDETSHNGVLMSELDCEEYAGLEYNQSLKEHLFIRDWLESKGYDSIVYDNKFEEGGKSILVLREEQIKIVSKEFLAQKNKVTNKPK